MGIPRAIALQLAAQTGKIVFKYTYIMFSKIYDYTYIYIYIEIQVFVYIPRYTVF
jgi:hypothetical protein